MEPKLFIATKAVIVHEGKILILREAGSYAEGTNMGRYDFPGGRLKPGEHFSQALGREVVEETGLSVQIGNPIAVNEFVANSGRLLEYFLNVMRFQLR